MINLASSSKTRAKILRDFGFIFKQILFNYDESYIIKKEPLTYAYNVVCAKYLQFKKVYPNLENLLFADSSVIVDNEIFGKAKNDEDAFYMLKKQSDNEASVITAMIYENKKLKLINLSITTFKFKKFDEKDLKNYIDKREYVGKAGAMMIEGFNKKYIVSQKGNTSTAMGLNAEILKAYI